MAAPNPPTSGVAALTGPLYRHLVATTLLDCLVVVAALALDAIAPWVASIVLGAALAQAAHAAYLRRPVPDAGAR